MARLLLKRLPEWWKVASMKHGGIRKLVKMICGLPFLIASLIFMRRAEYFRRMRACYSCPIFDPQNKRCKHLFVANMGCGCYTPFSNLVQDKCWYRKHMLDDEFGWDSSESTLNT